jgi:hypothetical protein
MKKNTKTNKHTKCGLGARLFYCGYALYFSWAIFYTIIQHYHISNSRHLKPGGSEIALVILTITGIVSALIVWFSAYRIIRKIERSKLKKPALLTRFILGLLGLILLSLPGYFIFWLISRAII